MRLGVLVVDVVSTILKCRALPDAAATILTPPPAGALGAKYLRRIEAQSQIPDTDLVLDPHPGRLRRRKRHGGPPVWTRRAASRGSGRGGRGG
jgi:hypothetical protein